MQANAHVLVFTKRVTIHLPFSSCKHYYILKMTLTMKKNVQVHCSDFLNTDARVDVATGKYQ